MSDRRADPDAQALSASGESPTGAPQTVLYVEDNPVNVMFVERVLLAHRPGVSLLVADTGARGVALASEHLPSLVLLDLFLPDIPGEVVLHQIRRDRRTSGLRVVILSGAPSAGQQERLRRAGADDVLTKPLRIENLLAVVDGTAITSTGLSAPVHRQPGPAGPARLHDLRRVYPDRDSWSTFLAAFLQDCHTALSTLERAAQAGDPDVVAHSAHTLAGLYSLVGDDDVLAILDGIRLRTRAGQAPDEGQLTALVEASGLTERALRATHDG